MTLAVSVYNVCKGKMYSYMHKKYLVGQTRDVLTIFYYFIMLYSSFQGPVNQNIFVKNIKVIILRSVSHDIGQWVTSTKNTL